MANIRVDLNTKIQDGSEIVFRSPVDCSAITGLIVYYPGEDENTTSKEFALADAHGNNVGDIDHLFVENVVVKVILDVAGGMAFVQNADTNAYLEGRFEALEEMIGSSGGGSGGTVTEERFLALEQKVTEILDEMNYEDIAITEFSCPGAGTYEMGRAVAAPTITWTLDKEPASQSLNGESLGVDVRSKAYSGNITSNKTYTLTVTGQKGETAKQSGPYTFYNGVYYGLLADGATIDSAAILTLNKKVQGSRGVTFTATPTSAMRIAYAIPASGYGTPVFKDAVSGFQVDMYRLDDPIQFENEHGYVTAYYVWLSTNLLEKEITVSVT